MAKKSKLPKTNFVSDAPSSCTAYKQSKEDIARQRRYAAEDGLRSIQRAEEIKEDKRLMGDIKALAQEQVSNLKRFCK